MGSVLSPDFAAAPLNRYGHAASLPIGKPAPVAEVAPAEGNPSRVVVVAPCQPDGKPLYQPGAWNLELKTGGGWTPVRQTRRSHDFVHWNAKRNRWARADRPSARPRRAEVLRFDPVPTTALRVVVRAPKSQPSVYEIEAYAE